MSEIRVNTIQNRDADSGPVITGITTFSVGSNSVTVSQSGIDVGVGSVTAKTIHVSDGQVISGVSTVDVITGVTSIGVGSVYASTLYGDASNVTGLDLSKSLTIGVRSGSAVTFAIVGSSFDVVGRSGNISIDV